MEKPVVPFGEWLNVKLGELDLSQRRFATAVGVSGVTVGKWIRGTEYPARQRIPLIAKALALHENDVWEAYRESPAAPYNDVTLARLLELPTDLNLDEILLLRHLFRGVRAYEREKGLGGQQPDRLAR